jgi:methionyl aminopeptidase
MALAIEPMLLLGQRHARVLDDGWTVVSEDGTWSAHFEHTVAITSGGPWVLTAEDGGRSGLARVGADGQLAAGPTASQVSSSARSSG